MPDWYFYTKERFIKFVSSQCRQMMTYLDSYVSTVGIYFLQKYQKRICQIAFLLNSNK